VKRSGGDGHTRSGSQLRTVKIPARRKRLAKAGSWRWRLGLMMQRSRRCATQDGTALGEAAFSTRLVTQDWSQVVLHGGDAERMAVCLERNVCGSERVRRSGYRSPAQIIVCAGEQERHRVRVLPWGAVYTADLSDQTGLYPGEGAMTMVVVCACSFLASPIPTLLPSQFTKTL
jgi:hypothetical protein